MTVDRCAAAKKVVLANTVLGAMSPTTTKRELPVDERTVQRQDIHAANPLGVIAGLYPAEKEALLGQGLISMIAFRRVALTNASGLCRCSHFACRKGVCGVYVVSTGDGRTISEAYACAFYCCGCCQFSV